MSSEKNQSYSSTKDLNKTLGKKELAGIAIGQIIGAGIMSMMGVAIQMTGRSANLAFMLSALFTMCTFFPSIFICSCIRMRGGQYSQMGIFVGDKAAGYYALIYLFTNMSLAMYALSFAQYFIALVPGINERVVAVLTATVFFILNYFGVDLMAKIQNLLVVVLIVALLLFSAYGIPQVDLASYFNNTDGQFMTEGFAGFLSATAYLGFATGGANLIINVSAECKDPKKDIPFVMITTTCGVALLYGVVATAAAGVLPVAEVAGRPLTLVAEVIFPQPIYVFFIVGGAMFALATTLNSQIMSCTKPIMQACEDGWYPRSFASLSKFKTPYKILAFFYLVAVIPVVLNLEIAQISSIVQILGYINNLIFTISCLRLPKLFPEQWEKSTFKVSDGVFKALLALTCVVILIQASFMLRTMTWQIVLFNVAALLAAMAFAFIRSKQGASPTVSYDLA